MYWTWLLSERAPSILIIRGNEPPNTRSRHDEDHKPKHRKRRKSPKGGLRQEDGRCIPAVSKCFDEQPKGGESSHRGENAWGAPGGHSRTSSPFLPHTVFVESLKVAQLQSFLESQMAAPTLHLPGIQHAAHDSLKGRKVPEHATRSLEENQLSDHIEEDEDDARVRVWPETVGHKEYVGRVAVVAMRDTVSSTGSQPPTSQGTHPSHPQAHPSHPQAHPSHPQTHPSHSSYPQTHPRTHSHPHPPSQPGLGPSHDATHQAAPLTPITDKDEDDVTTGSRSRGGQRQGQSEVPVLPPIVHDRLGPGVQQELANQQRETLSIHLPQVSVQPPTPQHSTLTDRGAATRPTRVPHAVGECSEADEEGKHDIKNTSTKIEKGHRELAPTQAKGQVSVSQRKRERAEKKVKKPTTKSVVNTVSGTSGGLTLALGSPLGGSMESLASEAFPSPQSSLDRRSQKNSFRGRALRVSGPPSDTQRSVPIKSPVDDGVRRPRGTRILAPGGEIVQIGGTVAPWTDPDEGDAIRTMVECNANDGDFDETSNMSADEKRLINALSDHAHRIAEVVLNQPGTGHDLVKDAQITVAEFLGATSSEDSRSSSSPTKDEYKVKLREALTSALSGAQEIDVAANRTDVSPELMDALLTSDLSPADLELVQDAATGNCVIRVKSGQPLTNRKSSVGQTLGDGFRKSTATDAPSAPPPAGPSIPAEKLSTFPNLGPDVINYGERGPAAEVGPSGGQNEAKGENEAKTSPSLETGDEDAEYRAALEDIIKKTQSLEAASPSGKSDKRGSEEGKSSKSGKSDKKSGRASDKTSGRGDSAAEGRTEGEKKKDEFIVGLPKDSQEMKRLYGNTQAPAEKKDKKPRVPKAKKGKKKKGAEEEKPDKAKTKPKPVETEKEKLQTPAPPSETRPTPDPSQPRSESEEEMEFIIVRDEFPPTPEPEVRRKSDARSHRSTVAPSTDYTEDDDDDDSTRHKPPPAVKVEDANLKDIGSKEARAAERAARATRRREEVERKRKEKEERAKQERVEQEERERLAQQMESELRGKEEERRRQRHAEEEEARLREMSDLERDRRARQEVERERHAREAHQRRLAEMMRQKVEEDKRRKELEEQRRLEELERAREEQEMLAAMADQEREEYERRKKEALARKKIEDEEKRRRQEEEAAKAMEEARRLAEEMARQQAELERRLQFNRGLHLESGGLEQTQDVSRAFVFSYFELLQWLGMEMPEFEKMKLPKY